MDGVKVWNCIFDAKDLQTKNKFAKQVALVVGVSRAIGRQVASNSYEMAIQVTLGPRKLCQRSVRILGDLRARKLPYPCPEIGDLRPPGGQSLSGYRRFEAFGPEIFSFSCASRATSGYVWRCRRLIVKGFHYLKCPRCEMRVVSLAN